MGSLFTTATGAELSGVTSGDVFLDFVAGTVTLPNGTVSNMNKNLNDLGLSQCNSIGVWTSDADSTILHRLDCDIERPQIVPRHQ